MWHFYLWMGNWKFIIWCKVFIEIRTGIALRDHSKHFALDEENLGLENVSELLGSHTWQVAELGPLFSSFQYDVAH